MKRMSNRRTTLQHFLLSNPILQKREYIDIEVVFRCWILYFVAFVEMGIFFFALRCRVPMNDWAAWPMLAKFCQHFLFSSALVRGQKLGTGWHCSYSHSILSGLWGSYQVWGEDSCLSEFAIKNMFQHFLLAFDWMRHFVIFPSPSGFFKSCFIFLKNSKPFFNLFFSALKWALSLKLCDFGGF